MESAIRKKQFFFTGDTWPPSPSARVIHAWDPLVIALQDLSDALSDYLRANLVVLGSVGLRGFRSEAVLSFKDRLRCLRGLKLNVPGLIVITHRSCSRSGSEKGHLTVSPSYSGHANAL